MKDGISISGGARRGDSGLFGRHGAGGAKALNFLQERARPDGLTLYLGPWAAPGIIAGDPALRYVPEELVMIGAGGLDRVTLMRTDVAPGIRKPADVMKVKSFNVGGRRPDQMLDFLGNLSMENRPSTTGISGSPSSR